MHRIARSALAALALAAAGTAHAQSYPAKPVRMVIPYPPGGATDVIGRVIANRLSETLGQQVVVDNRAGAAGNIGADMVAKATPDGYTILMGALTSHSINATLMKPTLQYDLVRDFQPVSIVGVVPLVFVATMSLPVKSLADLIALARSKPGSLTFASSGIGSPQHLAGEMFKSMAGIDMLHVAYKGSGPAMSELIGGQVQTMVETAPAALPQIKAGKLRPLATATAQRIAQLPDVPTATEAGLKGFEASSMFGILVPRGTPAPIVQRLNDDLAKIVREADTREKMAQQGVDATSTTPDEAAKRIAAEVAKWAKVITDAKVKAE
jgi:tripartite-type tricarboxylate transporter receptor subunit TctC